MAKSLIITYTLWMTLGWLGVHHFYLRRTRQAFAWWCSFGGCCGLGWLRDIWKIPEYVNDENDDPGFIDVLTAKMRQGGPPFNFVRFNGCLAIGMLFGLLGTSFIPEDIMSAHRLLVFIVPLFIATGVHLVGNIGRETMTFKSACFGAFFGLFWLWADNSSIGMPTLLSTLSGFGKGRGWRRTYTKPGYLKSCLVLMLCGSLYLSLWTSVFYHNVHVTTSDGEKVKVKDAIKHFFNSPAWREFKKSMEEIWEHSQEHGYQKTWEEFSKYLDPEGEGYAYEVLGVDEDASDEEISKAYKTLVKQWHPDRVKDPEKKEEASAKFMEIQTAYETLTKIKSRRTKHKHRSFERRRGLDDF